MFLLRKRKRNKKSMPKVSANKPVSPPEVISGKTYGPKVCEESNFGLHISKYIGQTVTIFVTGGGMSGAGFTGILLNSNDIYVKLITRIGPAPACSPGSTCTHFGYQNHAIIPNICCSIYNTFSPHFGMIRTLGSVAYIPSDKIASFVHNSV